MKRIRGLAMWANVLGQVRFNVLRVLPRTGKQVKQFNKF